MAKRQALIQQADATRLLKAAKAAGFARARLIRHPDGRVEVVAEGAEAAATGPTLSPFEQWQADNVG